AIDDINKPISESLKLVYQVGDGQTSTIQASGTVSAVQNNTLQIEKLAAAQKLLLDKVDLAVANPFLTSLGPDTQLAGLADGALDINAEGITGISANGQITIANIIFAGGPLVGGDEFKTDKVYIPVNITRTVVDPTTTQIKIEKLNVMTPEATLVVTGQVTQESLTNLFHHQLPGSEGDLAIKADITNLADIVTQFRRTLKIQQGVNITGGEAHEDFAMAIHKENIAISQKLSASIKGTRNGKPLAPQPITFTAESTAIPNGKPLPILRDIKIAWVSSFASIQGGGSLAQLGINGNFDLNKLRTELSQFVDLGTLQMQGTGDFAVSTNGDVSAPDAPISAKATLNLQNVKVSGVASQDASQENLALVATADLRRSDNAVIGIDKGNLTIIGGDPSDPMINVAATGNADLTTKAVSFDLNSTADLKKLQDQYGGLIPALAAQKIQIDSGTLNATANGSYDGKMIAFSKPAGLSIASLGITKDGRKILTRETIRATLNVSQQSDVIVADGKIDSSFAQASLSNAKISSDANIWDKLQSADVDAQVPDIAKVYALANLLTPAAPAAKGSAKTTPAAPSPLQITSGSASLKMNLSRDVAQKTTTLNVSDCQISNLALKRDNRQYQFDPASPITAKFVAAVQAGDSISSINISDLSADLGVAKISMPDKIVVTNLGATPTAQGSIKLEGAIAGAHGLAPLLTVLQGQDYPYSGDFVVVQKIQTQSTGIALDGTAIASNFQVIQNGKPVFSENQINLVDKVNIDPASKTAAVNTLTVDMAQSQALNVKFTGQVIDWENARTIKGINSDKAQLDLTYDGEKILPIVMPMLSPDLQAQYKDLKVKGKVTETYSLSGSYPAKPASNTPPIAFLNADGTMALEYLDLPQGLTIQNFELPFTLKGGILKTAAAPVKDVRKLPVADNAAPATQPAMANTALCNDGALNLDNIVLDLRSPDPLLSIGRHQHLLYHVKLNPVLADTMGHGNLLFKDAEQASGLLDIEIQECKNVPLGDLIKKNPKATAAVVFNVTDLQLDGPVPQVMGQVLNLGGEGIHGNIKNGTLNLSNGLAQTNFALLFAQQVQDQQGKTVTKNLPMTFKGGVVLASGALKDFNVTIPTELIPDKIGGKNLRQSLPNGLVVPFTGTTDHFKFDLVGAVTKSIGNSFLQGGGGNGQDPLQNLQNLLQGGGKKKKQKSDQ
ncbi:MAG TPA: hypothetical protein VKK61_07095, partial [Tepidisphaeraceae bacterium]|nr:hypothetical protein [Tepidisphaeraceae bacterium]